MNNVCTYINACYYTFMPKYKYFNQNEDDGEHYVGGNISITSHIINKLQDIKKIVKIIDINEECGIVIFQYISNGRNGSICEIKSNGIHYWLVNLF